MVSDVPKSYDMRSDERGEDVMRERDGIDHRLETFRDASMEFDHVYGLLAKSCGLSETEYWALVLIHEGVETQREISEQLSLSRQTLNSAFKLLVKKGLIRLEPFENDQRSKRALLTEKGRNFVGTTIAWTRHMEEQAWRTLNKAEQTDLIRLIRQFSDALRQALNRRQ